MSVRPLKLVVISHAGIKQINRAVYRELKNELREVHLIVPASLTLGSGLKIKSEPATANDPILWPLDLKGENPRTYFYPDLSRWLEVHQPDYILLENDPVSRIGFTVTTWAKRNGRRVIAQTYENLRRDLPSTINSKGIKSVPVNMVIHLMNYFMSSRIDGLLVVSRDSEDIFNGYGYRNVTRIPLGYDKDVFFPDESLREKYRAKMNLTENEVLIAYFGRLVRQKGVHLLLESLNEMKEMNWKLAIDGHHDNEDDYTSYIFDLIKKNEMIDRVIFFEADHFEIANYMRAADIMVAPSITTPTFKEQYGRAVQEAMACGCVTIVSDSGHLPDLVEDKALVFREGNSNELRDLIILLMMDKSKRSEYGSFLRERARNFLTTEIQSKKIEDVINQIKNND